MRRLRKPHLALYGNTAIARIVCPVCQDRALVVKGKFTCCDLVYGEEPKDAYRESQPEKIRRRPRPAFADAQLERQGNKCHYCDLEFGDLVRHREKLIRLRVEWDHCVPWVYSWNNEDDNFVAACQICNHIKSDLVFQSHEAAKEFIASKRAAKGYV